MNHYLIMDLILSAVCVWAVISLVVTNKRAFGGIYDALRCLFDHMESRASAYVEFCKLDPDARIPAYAHSRDSGMDIASIEDAVVSPGSFVKLRTGIAAKIPVGYELQVRPRSGLASRGILCAWGTVDEGYRGDIGITIFNHSIKPFVVNKGDRIAQLVLEPVCRAVINEVPIGKFDAKTDRGAAGFGSTGV